MNIKISLLDMTIKRNLDFKIIWIEKKWTLEICWTYLEVLH